MAELNSTLWDLLQTIQWSYAALWVLTPDRRMLKWQEGWFNLKATGDSEGGDSDNKNAELFYFLYNPLTFGPGVGYAGHALQNLGDQILWLAGDMALRSIPHQVENQNLFIKEAGIRTTICIPLDDKVLELGTVDMVPENDELAHCIKKILFNLLARYWKKPDPVQFSELSFGLDMDNLPTSTGAGPSMVAALRNELSSLTAKPMNQLMAINLPPVYGDLDVDYIVPQVSAPELMQNHMPWTPEQLTMPLVSTDLESIWSTSTLAALQNHGLSASSVGTSSLMVDHIEQGLPGFPLPGMQFIDSDSSLLAASTSVVEATRSLRDRSSSRSSLPSGAQIEDNEISSVAKVYADCQISEIKLGVGAGRESESSWMPTGRPRRSPSPKEMSPDSMTSGLPKPRNLGHGQQQSLKFHPGVTSSGPSPQRPRLERQSSSTQQHDSTPVLVQLGNVLQLGNARGQVAEAPPVEHDEAAVSHMLAERRRRVKQNANFVQLKALVPSAAKMDKASVLAETIVYINSLKARLETLEQCNQSLKFLVDRAADLPAAGESYTSPTQIPSTSRAVLREADKIEVISDGEGNLRIEIRNPCAQPETAIQILASLKQMQLKVISSQMSIDDNRITANFVVKMKRKNSTGQNEVCANVTSELRRCLGL